MVRYIAFVLSLLLQPLIGADDTVIFTGSGAKSMTARVTMSNEKYVAFVRMSDGNKFVRELATLSEENLSAINRWKAKQLDSATIDRKVEAADFFSELRFEKSWESYSDIKSGLINAAKSREEMIKVEKGYGKKLAEVSKKLTVDLENILHHQKTVLSSYERKRLRNIIQDLEKSTLPAINQNLKSLELIAKDDARNLRSEPIVWPELPYFPARGKVLNSVPHVKQLKSYCGPATSEMLLRYCGFELNQRQLAKMFSEDSANHHGTRPDDMVREMLKLEVPVELLRSKGILGYVPEYPANMSENKVAELIKKGCFKYIKKKIDADSPIITTVKHGRSGIGHFVCVIGYDYLGETPVVIFRNPVDLPGSKPQQWTLQKFVKYWIYEYNDGSFSLQAIALEK